MNLVRDLINAVAGVAAAGKVLSLNKSKETDHVVLSRSVTFTEDATNQTHTGDIEIPAGAVILDIIVQCVALWTATTASMIVGDGDDPDGFYTAVDLKATDLILGESIAFGTNGGSVVGAYSASSGTHWENQYRAAKRTITGVITVGTPATTAGRTRLIVVYVVPTTHAATPTA